MQSAAKVSGSRESFHRQAFPLADAPGGTQRFVLGCSTSAGTCVHAVPIGVDRGENTFPLSGSTYPWSEHFDLLAWV